jgi:phosphoribosylglycinamide formyltransferase-1
MAEPLPLAVLRSGRGSNMLAIAQATRDGLIAGRVATVISDRPDAAGLATARALSIPVGVVAPAADMDRAAFGEVLSAAVLASGARLVVLAGFMRILDGGFVRRWQGRLLNIHPSLLPAHRGLHTHRRVLTAGELHHGCTVHFVTEELDAGPRIIQGRLAVRTGEDEAALSARVQQLEHIIYPRAIAWFAAGRLSCEDGVARLDGKPLVEPVIEEMP